VKEAPSDGRPPERSRKGPRRRVATRPPLRPARVKPRSGHQPGHQPPWTSSHLGGHVRTNLSSNKGFPAPPRGLRIRVRGFKSSWARHSFELRNASCRAFSAARRCIGHQPRHISSHFVGRAWTANPSARDARFDAWGTATSASTQCSRRHLRELACPWPERRPVGRRLCYVATPPRAGARLNVSVMPPSTPAFAINSKPTSADSRASMEISSNSKP